MSKHEITFRDYTIILQNLLNRAVDIEKNDATVEKRKVKIENCHSNLIEIKKLFKEELSKYKGE